MCFSILAGPFRQIGGGGWGQNASVSHYGLFYAKAPLGKANYRKFCEKLKQLPLL